MAIKAGVGISKDTDSYRAGFGACTQALQRMGQNTADIIIVFSSVKFAQEEVIRGIREASGKSGALVGCTSAGAITNEGPSQNSVGVMAIVSDQIRFFTGLGKDIKSGAMEAGRMVARQVREKTSEELKTFIMFPDVLSGNGTDTLRGVLDILGAHFPVVGGAAGDDFLFEKTYQYKDDEIATGAVAGVGISGAFSFGIGVRHGWIPIGLPMKATKSKGAVLYELDNRPAIGIYEDYFGKYAEELKKEVLARIAITYPLGLKVPESGEEYLIRDPLSVDEAGSITCAAEIPEGAEIRLMIGTKERAIDAAKEASRRVMREFLIENKTPKFALMFNCVAREKLFGADAADEINAVCEIIGPDVPLLGFYTYGGQAPLGGEVRNPEKRFTRFYNQTAVICAIGE